MISGALIAAVSAKTMPYFQDNIPGAGFFPFWIGVLFSFLSIFPLVESFRNHDAHFKLFEKREMKAFLVFICGSVAVIIVTPVLGFLPSIGLLVGAASRLQGTKSWKVVLSLTILTPIVFYLFFAVGFGVPIPMGIFKQ
jgi:hypothetical protein